MASIETIRGYILEEVLAYLIRNTGYRLLVDERQDTVELGRSSSGLYVRGRGGHHQVDVLGQLKWIPAFTFPIRLFIEAKFRTKPVGIAAIRNAVGVIDDINQNYVSQQPNQQPRLQRYSYHYALFSTSGFTSVAAKYALAHQISLIDLSAPGFNPLRTIVGALAEAVEPIWNARDAEGPKQIALRVALREALGTWPPGVEHIDDEPVVTWVEQFRQDAIVPLLIQPFMRIAGEMFVGMANGPYLLVFQTSEPEMFLQYARQYPSHRVRLRWSWGNSSGLMWRVEPADTPPGPAYTLSFPLPKPLADWIFASRQDARSRALMTKADIFSDITIYHYSHEPGERPNDELFRLQYDPTSVRLES